ncbi:MAG TPA: TRAM domain-containing protein [Candidatus Salinicoccus stercoripullorum]|uniref:TRAM domain-containing protein n=1 Tax=Candidatus Salinicoccus stercoripullorum TaxID=2838756 RepID=A0A9D1QJQ3_9STAP|nr:TRAM domain-containing protein [Candidatus Salinicoccus stercoripullorum]
MLKYLLYLLYFLIGISLGVWLFPELAQALPVAVPAIIGNVLVYGVLGGLLFLGFFLWTVPKFESLIRKGEGLIMNRNLSEIVFATLGMIIGLLIAVLISLLINTMDIPVFGDIIPFVLAVVLGYLGFQIGLKKFSEVLELLPKGGTPKDAGEAADGQKKFLDTSAIIDGRIVDVLKTGFVEGELIIPQFVLDELQLIADATDPIKRDKGKRGLDMLNALQELSKSVNIMPVAYEKLDVDHQLIELAKEEDGAVVTTDYNLNKICQLHQIKVLNVNELSDAIKMVVIQGDTLDLLVSKAGKEENQGVGYLEDGTMVVVENGRKLINQTIKVEVTSVLQTNSGRIIFSKKVS